MVSTSFRFPMPCTVFVRTIGCRGPCTSTILYGGVSANYCSNGGVSYDSDSRNRDDELAALVPIELLFLKYFLLVIPGEKYRMTR